MNEQEQQLVAYFEAREIPSEEVVLSPGVKVTNPKKFVSSHLECIKSLADKRMRALYADRLLTYKKLIS